MAELTAILDATVRRERGRIVGGLLRLCGSLDAAEEAFQDAVLAAMRAWLVELPANPGAWLMTAAKNRAKDAHRHRAVEAAHAQLVGAAAYSSSDPRDSSDVRSSLASRAAPAVASEAASIDPHPLRSRPIDSPEAATIHAPEAASIDPRSLGSHPTRSRPIDVPEAASRGSTSNESRGTSHSPESTSYDARSGSSHGSLDGPDPIDVVADDYLRLIVTCCHPALTADNQIALTLKVVCGFSTDEIARALLSSEATVSQRILRAKRTIADAQLADTPLRDDTGARIAAVLGVIYAMFNEGHVARSGALQRLDLQAEALRLGRLVCDLAPAEPEAFGVVALVAFAAARAHTRADADGLPILLDAQDRSTWDRALVREGLMALQRARSLGGRGAYVLQAEIAASHVTAPTWDDTDWLAIVVLYDELAASAPSPVVSLNRAIALAMRDGPTAGLVALEDLVRALADYHLFYATRAELLARAGKDPRPDLRKAIELATNPADRALLERRLAQHRRR
jgi:RNA polymerase sigma-70 factor (ECF subfamily)